MTKIGLVAACPVQLFGGVMAIAGKQLTLNPPAFVKEQTLQDDEAAPLPSEPQRADINLDNVIKLIPGEVIAPFIAGTGVTVPFSATRPWIWPSLVFIVCLFLCGFLRAVASKPIGEKGLLKDVNWSLVYVSLGAFFIWAHAVNASLPLAAWLPPAAWGFFAMIYGIIAPYLVIVRQNNE